MKLHAIETGLFKLDGGAMFGVVPKSIWSRFKKADENNLCTWAMRCLLIEDGDRLTLVDTGIGDKQSEKFFSYFQPHGEDSLEKSLKAKGFGFDDITDVFLTHLHFDHCGGAVYKDSNALYKPTFKHATYWSNEKHWDWAVNPNAREKASFLKENILPIQESGQLKFIKEGENYTDQIGIHTVNGHTEAQMLPKITIDGKTIVFMGDLLPSHGHLPIPYVMGYDVRPLLTLQEKESFLEEALNNEYILMFEHDTDVECCTLERTERGIRMKESLKLEEIF